MLTFGTGLLDKILYKIPVELHLPGYQFCGPNTDVSRRIARGEQGINPLDAACREHDIAYTQYKDLKDRHKADRILAEKAWNRVKNPSSLGERLAALAVTGAMKAKLKFGMGSKRKKRRGMYYLKKRRRQGKGGSSFSPGTTIKAILAAAGAAPRKRKGVGRRKRRQSRIISTPSTLTKKKRGGILPLIFAGLSALGAMSGGMAAIAKTAKDVSAKKEQMKETQRHNRAMEAAAAASGKGLYLRPYRKYIGGGGGIRKRHCRLKKKKNYRTGRYRI